MIELMPRETGGRRFLTGLFAMWGMGGFALAVFATMAAPVLTASMIALVWIGGILFFGLGALIAPVPYRWDGFSVPVYVTKPPRADGLNDEHRGVPFKVLPNGQVVAEFADGQRTFKNWQKFLEGKGTP
jgi:hypothetical protein